MVKNIEQISITILLASAAGSMKEPVYIKTNKMSSKESDQPVEARVQAGPWQ